MAFRKIFLVLTPIVVLLCLLVAGKGPSGAHAAESNIGSFVD